MSVMIDWISCVIPLAHEPIPTGRIMSVDVDGEIEFAKPKPKLFEGSYESKIVLRSQGVLDQKYRNTQLFLSGNPSKFLQGHNVFGIDDLRYLLLGVFRKLSKTNQFNFDLFQLYGAIDSATVSRIDLTDSIRFQNRQQCRAYIHQLSSIAHTKNSRPSQDNWTLHFQPKSKRWNAVIYTKGDEVSRRTFPESFKHKDFIINEADSLVRVEIRLKTLDLKRLDSRYVYQLTPKLIQDLYQKYIGRLKMSETIELTDEQLKSLTPSYQSTYMKWKAGIDIQGDMTTSTYYRHRSKLLKIGVDISVPYKSISTAEILPLKRVLKAERYDIPQEAHDRGLVYKPEPVRLITTK